MLFFSGNLLIESLRIDGLTKFVITQLETTILTGGQSINATVLLNIGVAAEFTGNVQLFDTIPIYAKNGNIG